MAYNDRFYSLHKRGGEHSYKVKIICVKFEGTYYTGFACPEGNFTNGNHTP